VEKIWLAPMKIWSMVREETVGGEGGGAVKIPSSDMVSAPGKRVAWYIILQMNACSLTSFLFLLRKSAYWVQLGKFASMIYVLDICQ